MKANTQSQKTLEGQLLVVKNGEWTTLYSKVADLNGVMLQYLGVSIEQAVELIKLLVQSNLNRNPVRTRRVRADEVKGRGCCG